MQIVITVLRRVNWGAIECDVKPDMSRVTVRQMTTPNKWTIS
jgi:hypothetical protein